ncbi:hypothetical protein K6Q96_24035 [Grimontia kaedaensis]|uniref:Uncharacterized protein n=1 Tax=Grimontia kaedaensis TaxID=2872157 RepID=A0ABY4X0J5_9GAMM|nr:hypothetical protein [Grimontia kaedaensis]USH04779.1 hypothetical protein K6Q96_24035 [Grimontia kaedaensis]
MATTTTTFNTGEKAVNAASFAFIFSSIFCLVFTLIFYLTNDEKYLFKNIAFAFIIFVISFSYISGRSYKNGNPIHYWASTSQKVMICYYLTFGLQPLFFITSLPGTAYWAMTFISLSSGLVSYAFGKHYFDPKTQSQKMAKEGMLKQDYAAGSRTASGSIFHAFRTPTNPVALLFVKTFKSILIGFAILAVLFGAGAGFILLALFKTIVPATTEISPHAVVLFLVMLPMTTAGMAYLYPITAFIKQWGLNSTASSEK